MAKTKELKKRYGAEEGRIVTSVLERAVSRERLFLFNLPLQSRLRASTGDHDNRHSTAMNAPSR